MLVSHTDKQVAERADRASKAFGASEVIRVYVEDVLTKAGIPLVNGRVM